MAARGRDDRAPAPSAVAVAYLVVEAETGTVLAEKEAHKRWPPASMTKMMTVLIAMERVRDGAATLDEPVHVSAWASRIGGSQVYLSEGETFSLGEMLKAIMIASANDAAVAVAEHIAGSTHGVRRADERARQGARPRRHDLPERARPPAAPGQTADLTSAARPRACSAAS